jgi:glycogen debranching enzyme
MHLNGLAPTLLQSSAEKSCLLSVDLTNPDIQCNGRAVRNQTINIHRSRLVRGAVYERNTLVNYGIEPVEVEIRLDYAADYRDIFEVRGYALRSARGELLPPQCGERSVVLGYRGLDGVIRKTSIRFSEIPEHLDATSATFRLHLPPRDEVRLEVTILPEEGDETTSVVSYDTARHSLELSYTAWLRRNTQVETSSDRFDEMIRRAVLDLRLLTVETSWGPVLAAGVPWFACVFGRDSLLAALQSLSFCPDLARSTLRLLAHFQGKEVNAWTEEEPGKMLHELRRGEMAAMEEVPHTPYYGTADATPLWLIVLAETYRWTGDRALVDDLWEPAIAALEWIDRYGDADGDGYVEYRCQSPSGVINHGWKDSAVSVFHTDGSLAEQPIALVEVQAYVYAAKRKMADLCELRGDVAGAARLRAQAETFRERFHRDYWMPERSFLAFALDGHKRQVQTITSNPGHALWTEILEPEAAAVMIPRFAHADLLSGWGIRCVGERETGYNPMGYHLGTVWPHDASLLVAGLRRYGDTQHALRIVTQLYRAGLACTYYRLPEVFAGFARAQSPFPVPYPVACSPQAWSAGTILLLLQSMLGLSPDAGNRRIALDPALPDWLREVRLSNLRVGDATLDLHFAHQGDHVTAQVLQRSGHVDVLV